MSRGGYSRLVGIDEEGTVARLRALRSELIDLAIAGHRGRIVKTTGAGILIEFASVVDAVRAAIEVQRAMAQRNARLGDAQRIDFRVGVHLGDVLMQPDSDLMGDGVNIAARLEGIAESGGICLSGDAYRQVRDKVTEDFTDLGDRELKNIARPVRVYAISSLSSPSPPHRGENLMPPNKPPACSNRASGGRSVGVKGMRWGILPPTNPPHPRPRVVAPSLP
jgi:adenylate cyclase